MAKWYLGLVALTLEEEEEDEEEDEEVVEDVEFGDGDDAD